MSDELVVVEMEYLIQNNESMLSDKQDTLSYAHPNEKTLPHTSELHTEKDANNFTKTKDSQKLFLEVLLVCVMYVYYCYFWSYFESDVLFFGY